jgi:hypothetical protein
MLWADQLGAIRFLRSKIDYYRAIAWRAGAESPPAPAHAQLRGSGVRPLPLVRAICSPCRYEGRSTRWPAKLHDIVMATTTSAWA